MSKLIYGCLLALFLPKFALGEGPCGKINGGYTDLLHCAEHLSPAVKAAELEVRRALAGIAAAGQWENPALALDSYPGREQGETEIALGIPLALGGKIGARKSVAEGELRQAEALLFSAKAKARGDMLLRLHRLRQLLHEREVVQESISTFSTLISQYAKRRGLSPEQEISASVFRMAKSEYDLKEIETVDEISEVETEMKLVTGLGIANLQNILPPSPKFWPKLEARYSPGSSGAARWAQANLLTAEGQLILARSEAWPTVTVGPSLKLVNEGASSSSHFGFNVGFPLPLFSVNGGGRAQAQAAVAAQEEARSLALLQEQARRGELLRTYRASTEVLKATLSHQEIEKKHSDVERLFLRGIVPSSLVIEAHRTFVELEKSRNAREQKALGALVEIYAIDGQKLEGQIN